jgi:hypothetical protein
VIFIIRFTGVGLLNYAFGNGVFTLFWLHLSDTLSYSIIVLFTTVLGSVFSFFTHRKFTLNNTRGKTRKKLTIYTSFQVVFLFLSIITVPKISEIFQINILLLQYIWSASVSLLGVIIIAK